MAGFFWVPAGIDSDDTNAGMPGAQPNGSQMQGNPNMPNGQPDFHPPLPQNPVQQLTHTQISAGNLPTNLQPTTTLQGSGPTQQGGNAGGDSLLAQMSRGQVIKKDTTYGMSQFIPANGGAGIPVNATVVPVATGPASNLTYPAPGSQNHTGN